MSQVIQPKAAFFIRLGRELRWEEDCIENNTIRLGYVSPLHQESLDGDWDALLEFWMKSRVKTEASSRKSVASNDVRQIKEFYTQGSDTLWITFHGDLLYWGFAGEDIEELNDKTRVRQLIQGWSCKDLKGALLNVDRLPEVLTRVRKYRGTICEVKALKELLRLINCV